jgi:rod shape determining protein RodA
MRLVIIWVIGLFLSLLSLVVLKSITPDLVTRQFWFFCFGWLVSWLLLRFPNTVLAKYSGWIYWLLVLVLLLLLFTGSATRGTVGWFELGWGFKIQPSQFAIPLVAWYVADFISKKQRTFWQVGWRVALPGILIAVEPDFGTAAVYFMSLSVFFWQFSFSLKHMVGVAVVALFSLAVLWLFVFKPYQRDRLVSFLFPTRIVQVGVESSAQYNARQALIAVGSGQITGQGLGQGVQSHLRFLPERQTDFIFASLAEEIGLVGSLTIVVCYAILIGTLLRVVFQYTKLPQLSYILSFVMFIFIQTAINIGMNIGLVPITGITLPLLSYGGSSILAFCIGLGLVMNQMSNLKPKVVLKIT